MKYYFIELSVQDGEREHTHRVLTQSRNPDKNKVATDYAANFWGDSEEVDGGFEAWGGEILIKVSKVLELTKEEFEFVYELFYTR